LKTYGRVGEAGGVVKERLITDGRVGEAGGIVKERVLTQSGVVVAQTPLLANCSRRRRKPKEDVRYGDENWQNCCVFEFSQRIHGFLKNLRFHNFVFQVS
jgi:hypothetical protein